MGEAAEHSEQRATNWRQSKWLAIAELVVVALIFYADYKHRIFFSKTPYLALFAWLSLGRENCAGGTWGSAYFATGRPRSRWASLPDS